MMQKTDYLIIGQGLAGTLLAYFLMQRGNKVRIVDLPSENSSSRVAAGIYNPITGRRFVKTWMADDIFPFAAQTYRELEVLTGTKFHFPSRIVRMIATAAERNELEKKTSMPEYRDYIEPIDKTGKLPLQVEIRDGGNLDVELFIRKMGDYFSGEGVLLREEVDYRDILTSDDKVEWKDIRAGRLIFCEGFRAMDNPWFGYLPFTHAKGELLTIRAAAHKQDHILSRGIFILPLGDDLYKVGATYDWNDLSEAPTEAAKSELLDKLKTLLDVPFMIIRHQAGIRPTVRDRRPLMGMHPSYPLFGIFNGLGTKGVSLGPYFANHFAEYLGGGISLMGEVDIKRFDRQ